MCFEFQQLKTLEQTSMPTFRKREKVLAIILVAVLALNRIQERNLMQALSNRSSAAVTVIGQDRATRKNLNEFIKTYFA